MLPGIPDAAHARLQAPRNDHRSVRCRSFRWARYRTTSRHRQRCYTLLDLRGNIPSFIHIFGWQAARPLMSLDMLLPEAGAIYVVDRGYVDFARNYVLHQAGAFFVTACQVEHRCWHRRPHSACPTDTLDFGIIVAIQIRSNAGSASTPVSALAPNCSAACITLPGPPSPARRWSSSRATSSLPAATICALYKSRWQVELKSSRRIKQHRRRSSSFYGLRVDQTR